MEDSVNNLQTIRQRLEARLAQLEQRLDRIERNRRRVGNTLERDWQEQAAVRQNDEVLDGLHEEESIQIVAIHAALKRIDEGTYGTCVACDEPIAAKRLEALPYTTLCIECAEALERKGQNDS